MKTMHFRKKRYCLVVAMLALFAISSNSLYAVNNSESVTESPQPPQELKAGIKAPPFTVIQDGKSISLADLEFMVVVVNFSSTSTENRKIDANIAQLKEKYKGADIAFVNIPIDRYVDIAAAYGVNSTPAVCIIKPDGAVYSMDYGQIDLAQKLKDLFGI